ncbi:MAG TPA: dipeptidase [Gammaproteobacteria bacterium]
MSASFPARAAAAALLLAGLLAAGCGGGASEPGRAPSFPGTLDDGVLTIDTHVDIPFDYATEAVDPLDADLQVNLEKMRAGGLDVAFFVVYVGQEARTEASYAKARDDALTKFAAIRRMAEQYPDWIEIATSPDAVERIARQRKLVAAIGIENGFVIGKDLALLDRYYELGARYFGLVHNGHNDLGFSAQPREALGDAPGSGGGLTPLGAAVVERLNRLGIMVDVSHASKRTALDAIRLSRAPVIASHSAVRSVADHPRNLDDETLLALRDNGGVVQIVAFEPYVKVQPPEQRAAVDALAAELGLATPVDVDALPEAQRNAYLRGIRDINTQWPPASVEDLVDHVDYAVRLIGIDHVGLSSDFGGGGGIVGWADAAETWNVTAELRRRGYSDEDIRKIWGGNLLRVWREVEGVAATLR